MNLLNVPCLVQAESDLTLLMLVLVGSGIEFAMNITADLNVFTLPIPVLFGSAK